jgi:hypothetical protein
MTVGCVCASDALRCGKHLEHLDLDLGLHLDLDLDLDLEQSAPADEFNGTPPPFTPRVAPTPRKHIMPAEVAVRLLSTPLDADDDALRACVNEFSEPGVEVECPPFRSFAQPVSVALWERCFRGAMTVARCVKCSPTHVDTVRVCISFVRSLWAMLVRPVVDEWLQASLAPSPLPGAPLKDEEAGDLGVTATRFWSWVNTLHQCGDVPPTLARPLISDILAVFGKSVATRPGTRTSLSAFMVSAIAAVRLTLVLPAETIDWGDAYIAPVTPDVVYLLEQCVTLVPSTATLLFENEDAFVDVLSVMRRDLPTTRSVTFLKTLLTAAAVAASATDGKGAIVAGTCVWITCTAITKAGMWEDLKVADPDGNVLAALVETGNTCTSNDTRWRNVVTWLASACADSWPAYKNEKHRRPVHGHSIQPDLPGSENNSGDQLSTSDTELGAPRLARVDARDEEVFDSHAWACVDFDDAITSPVPTGEGGGATALGHAFDFGEATALPPPPHLSLVSPVEMDAFVTAALRPFALVRTLRPTLNGATQFDKTAIVNLGNLIDSTREVVHLSDEPSPWALPLGDTWLKLFPAWALAFFTFLDVAMVAQDAGAPCWEPRMFSIMDWIPCLNTLLSGTFVFSSTAGLLAPLFADSVAQLNELVHNVLCWVDVAAPFALDAVPLSRTWLRASGRFVKWKQIGGPMAPPS